MKILIVAGARPNFMKIAPIMREFEKRGDLFQTILVHTKQHYSPIMSDSFFTGLGIKVPDYNLSFDSSKNTHAYQTASIMMQLEDICNSVLPDIVLVVGDVNSTLAAAIVAKKLNIKLCHVEAGLRSGDRSMPEEINRIATDSISDILFVTEESGINNLLKEGHDSDSIHFVGNVMIDNLLYQLSQINFRNNNLLSDDTCELSRKIRGKYICLTLHRPSNVDNKERLMELLSAVNNISETTPVIFPCHLRTLKNIHEFGINTNFIENWKEIDEIKSGVIMIEPLGYNDFLYLWKDSSGVVTDSGGIQEETTALKIPCLTVRDSTERPITVEVGSNVLLDGGIHMLYSYIDKMLSGNWKKSSVPKLWDGNASKRIIETLSEYNN